FIGASNLLNPLEKFTSLKMTQVSDEKLIFKKFKNIQELELAIKNSNIPVMLDFWTSWCVSCKELGEITFQDEQVINKLQE
ncbi:thioredoxin domain-containing protein, partial [Aliarcobacter butzleri]|uniref:thioredoxin domain-containing protein n=1 Tax=Aliarcobacter butzleri TaxID=28197 RepID=UPI003B219B2C